jgi:hypothetical protein
MWAPFGGKNVSAYAKVVDKAVLSPRANSKKAMLRKRDISIILERFGLAFPTINI